LIAIVAAMKDEVARLGGLSRRSKGMAQVTVTGVGKDKVIAAMETLLQGEPYPSLVLSVGFSGALSDDLNTGDLILARNLYLVESTGVLEVDNRYYQLAERAINENVLPYVRRDTLTVPNIVRTQAEREHLAQTYNAQAVNMEDYWVCSAAARAGVPFLSVRAVLDMTHQEIPLWVEEIMWQRERRQGLRILLSSLARPIRIPKLLSLARGVKTAQKSLGEFVRSFVAKVIEGGVGSPA